MEQGVTRASTYLLKVFQINVGPPYRHIPHSIISILPCSHHGSLRVPIVRQLVHQTVQQRLQAQACDLCGNSIVLSNLPVTGYATVSCTPGQGECRPPSAFCGVVIRLAGGRQECCLIVSIVFQDPHCTLPALSSTL